MKKDRRGYLLIIGLVILILFMNLPAVYTFFYHDITNAPEAVNGTMDLSHVNLSDGKAYLDGQWEFYWRQFLVSEPKGSNHPDFYIKVPGAWSDYQIAGKHLDHGGFGSYRLHLTGLLYEKDIAIYVPDFGGAYRIFIDGSLASSSGTTSKDTTKIFTVPKSTVSPVLISSKASHEIIIEVASERFSGFPYMTPILGDYHQIESESTTRNTTRLILFGIAIFSFLSLIVMYVSVRRKIQSFWLPVMIAFILLRIMLTTEFYSVWQPILFFNLSYESINELMYLSTFVLKFLLIFLLQEQCGIEFSSKQKISFAAYYAILYLVFFFAPQSSKNAYLSTLIPMLTYVLDITLFVKIFRARDHLKKFGMVIFWGAMLVVAGLTIDSYYINGKIYMNMSLLLLFLFTLFSLIMNWVYAMRTGDLFDNFMQSSTRLALANSEISMQKDYFNALQSQMDEIREMKHDIRHFVGVMNRLADENKIDAMKTFLQEYGEKTKMDQLPVFCEHIIANSVIGYYYLRAKAKDVPFASRCQIKEDIPISDSDICILLGNALENAIDACLQMDQDAKQYVVVEAESSKGQFLIKVRNTYKGQLKKKTDGFSQQRRSSGAHGLGVRNMERVVLSYGGLIKIEHDHEEFTFMAAIPNK